MSFLVKYGFHLIGAGFIAVLAYKQINKRRARILKEKEQRDEVLQHMYERRLDTIQTLKGVIDSLNSRIGDLEAQLIYFEKAHQKSALLFQQTIEVKDIQIKELKRQRIPRLD